jgi:hypothetical protein
MTTMMQKSICARAAKVISSVMSSPRSNFAVSSILAPDIEDLHSEACQVSKHFSRLKRPTLFFFFFSLCFEYFHSIDFDCVIFVIVCEFV